MTAFLRRGRSLTHALVIGTLLGATQVSAFATGSVTLAWMPSTDASVVGYNLYYGGASGVYTNTIHAANTTNTVVSGLIDGATYYFAATAYDSNGVESPFSNEASYAVPLTVVNNPPTLNTLGDLTLNQNANLQTVNLNGITSGAANENQTLTVSAASSNPALIPTPAIIYGIGNTTGYLTFAPVSNASGTATITVTVNDGQALNNTITRSFTVTVNAVNQTPTLNALSNLTINQNASQQTVNLSGITSGAANESQTLTVSVVSSNPALIPAPTVSYASPNTSGSLSFAPVNNASGTATITVTVNDGQALNNTITRSFTVTVNAVNQTPTLNALSDLTINQNASLQTVNLIGISSGAANENQTLTVTAASSNPALIPVPTVSYASPNTSGSLSFAPVNNASGIASITISVNDGGSSNNIITRSFTVTVNAVNQTPTLNTLSDLTIDANVGLQTVSLSGIGSGAANESQTLTVSAVSSNPALIPVPTVSYASPNTSGSLSFAPVNNASGTATITVTVNDRQALNNTITRSFTVTVNAVILTPTLNPISDLYVTKNAAAQTVTLTGISPGPTAISANTASKQKTTKQTIKVTAVSGNTKLLTKPTIRYSSPGSVGTLSFKPVKNATGTTTITVTVNNGAKINNLTTRTFQVTVLATGLTANIVAVPATLKPAAHASGQFALDIAGSPGTKYIVQASTDMVHWTPVQTNAAPFTYTDAQAGKYSQRFYRTVSTQ